MRLKRLWRPREEVLQLEVVRALEREPEALRAPFLAPEEVLGEAARPRADVREEEGLVEADHGPAVTSLCN